MEARPVSAVWGGPDRDILTVLAYHLPDDYLSDPSDEDESVVFHRVTDDRGEATGDIIGIEILDFLGFDKWDALPTLPEPWQLPEWQLPGSEPLPLADLLKQLQTELRTRARTTVRA